MNKLVMFFLMVVALSNAYAQENSAVVIDVTVAEFSHLIDSLQEEVLIDLRTAEEIIQGKIADAIVIDYFGANFEPAIQNLDRDKVYLLYCAGGGRSADTAEIMKGMGFRKVYNLHPGFNGWVKGKMPVQK